MKKILLLLFLFSFEICKAQQWYPLEGGLSGTNSQTDKVAAMCVDSVNHVLYVAGKFSMANDTMTVNNIAKWDGNSWSQVLSNYYGMQNTNGVNYTASVSALTIYQNKLFIGINKTGLHGVAAITLDSLYSWEWGEFNGDVNSFCVYKDTLYVCGAFTSWHPTFGGPTYQVSGIAKWNGALWVQVGGGISVGGFSEVNALCVHHNKLYAAGIFENAGGTYCKNIACWNDTSWSAVGNGIGFSGDFGVLLYTLESYHNKLYAGGDFYTSSSGFATGLAIWDDSNWSAAQINPVAVYDLKTIDDKLYLAANWAGVGASGPWGFVSVFNDTSWIAPPKGPRNEVYTFEKFDSSIYVGGYFNTINDGAWAGLIARYDPTIIQDTTAIVEVKQNGSAINIYPNPAANEIKISNLSPEATQITIYNLLGARVGNFQKVANANNITLNISDLQVGIYFIHLTYQDGSMAVRKFIRATD